jgi:xylose isomerase
MTSANGYQPRAEDKFSFGLWTVGNPGRDAFGDAVRQKISPIEIVRLLAEVGAWGVNENDLVPIDATAAERDCIVRRFKQACESHGIVVPMATVSLFFHPVFRDGAFTANDPEVRAYVLQKTLRAMDIGAELGAKIFVSWGAVRALRPTRAAVRMRPSSDCAKQSTIFANTTSSADMA